MFVVLAKDKLRKIINWLGLDLTQNLKYDRLTQKIIKASLKNGGIGIDVGCHKGEILDAMIKSSQDASHYGFEPIPYLYDKLMVKYGDQHHILPFALAEEGGSTTFNLVKNAPAYSGIKERKYDIAHPDIEKIDVQVRKLDELIHKEAQIAIIKIDVEGAEMGVLKGGRSTIVQSQPVILFEFGLGASDIYGTTPDHMYSFFKQLNYQIYLLEDFLNAKNGLTLAQLEHAYTQVGEYYFVAAPITSKD